MDTKTISAVVAAVVLAAGAGAGTVAMASGPANPKGLSDVKLIVLQYSPCPSPDPVTKACTPKVAMLVDACAEYGTGRGSDCHRTQSMVDITPELTAVGERAASMWAAGK